MTTPTPSTMKSNMPTPSPTTPTTLVGGFGSTSPTSKPGSKELMDLANKFITEYCMLDHNKVPPTPSPGCSRTTSCKSSTPTTPPATSSTGPSTGLQTRDYEPTCADSESSTTSRIRCSPPSSAPIIKSRQTKRRRSSSPDSSYRLEWHRGWGSTSSGILKQPTTTLRIAAMRRPCLLAMAYPRSSLAKDLAMGSLPLPSGSATEPVGRGHTTSTASGATSSKTTPEDAPTGAAIADTNTRTTCARSCTSGAPGTGARSCGSTQDMGSSAQQQSLDEWRGRWTWTATTAGCLA